MSLVRGLFLFAGFVLFCWDDGIDSMEAMGLFIVTVSFGVSEICEAIREAKQ